VTAATKRQTGDEGEALAARHLESQGYKILARNYRCRGGELDIVAADGATVAFVEVKTRRTGAFGSPFDAVDHRKRARMTTAALTFVAEHRLAGRALRFDVVAVWARETPPRVELLRNAFEAQG
jgi:putative endonuclease